jgi:hypothetical protein
MVCHHHAFLLHSAGHRRLEALWIDLTASLWQRAYPVPGRQCSLNATCLKTLEKRDGSKARLHPCDTSRQGKRAAGTRRFEPQDHRAGLLVSQEQPMLHP